MERIFCLIIGYFCGCFLTAEMVACLTTGESTRNLGSGNPGMANIASQLGLKWGAMVLAGDVGKVAIACLLCRVLLFPGLGQLGVLWSGLGAVLGHNFPFWRRFRGGKGVAATCACLVFTTPVWGGISCLVGLAVVVLTGYLPLGAVVIPVIFLPQAFFALGMEAGTLALVLTLLMLTRHIRGIQRVARGVERRIGPAGRWA